MFGTAANRLVGLLWDGADLAVDFATLGEYRLPERLQEAGEVAAIHPSGRLEVIPSGHVRTSPGAGRSMAEGAGRQAALTPSRGSLFPSGGHAGGGRREAAPFRRADPAPPARRTVRGHPGGSRPRALGASVGCVPPGE